MHDPPEFHNNEMQTYPVLQLGFVDVEGEKVSLSSANGKLIFQIEQWNDKTGDWQETYITLKKEDVEPLIKGIRFIVKKNIWNEKASS